MYILFTKRFRKAYKKLPKPLQKRCDERLLLFESNPFDPILNNHALHEPYLGCQSINITGDYRAIYCYGKTDSVRFIIVGTHHELFGT